MKTAVGETLDLDTILRVLEGFAATEPGRELARELAASTDPAWIRHALAETSEARRLIDEGGEIPIAGLPDLRPHLEVLRVEQRALEPRALVDLVHLNQVMKRVRAALSSRSRDLPLLAELAQRLPELDALETSIAKAIDRESLEIKDEASPALRSLRARIFKLRNRLRSVLESYLRQADSRRILQEAIITERNGRAVLPVKAECRGQLVGIVHGSSASGATLFIEPLSTVEINNDVVSLEDSERQEIARILLALTEAARSRREDIARAIEICARLDFARAKALLSRSYDGARPRIADGPTFRLVAARHPLLVEEIARRAGSPPPAREVVPISFEVSDARRALVFTGPNTGGKTVALKTAGLLSLMFQCGLHVPAAPDSVFPVFQRVFADIGDEQSIGSSLSTFSAHLQKIVGMDRDLVVPALVILDEVGTGTDPGEGGALGTALVEHFRLRGALVLASTHHGMLKAYASTTPGVGSASFEFDPVTYEPTYQLVEGSAGRSLAFEMALRLGLPAELVRKARALQSEKERQVEDMLSRLEADAQQLARDRERVAEERSRLDELIRHRQETEQDDARRREQRLASFRAELQAEIERARRELRTILEDARRQVAREAARDVGRMASARMDLLAAELPPLARPAPSPRTRDPRPGDRVSVPALGISGVVLELLANDQAEVSVRDKKIRVAVSELQPGAVEREAPSPPGPAFSSQLAGTKQVPQELNVIGCTVDEALSQADKFLDDAYLSEHRTVRLVHGLGTGRLQKAIRSWLADHPHVARHQSEGSGAVTVVELKG